MSYLRTWNDWESHKSQVWHQFPWGWGQYRER